jgi:acetyltransferase-like isoleucine patch superfamily enzyme
MRVLRRIWSRVITSAAYYRGPYYMSKLRQRWTVMKNPKADIQFIGHVYLGPGFSLHMPHGGTFIAGPNVEFRRRFRAEVGPNGRIVIGEGSRLTYDVIMQCGVSIEIGKRVMFGQSTLVVDGNHRFRELDRPMLAQGYDFRPLKIEDDATVTTKCTVINDIGRRAFIGANSVVSRPVPAYCVAVGVPARPIEYFGPPGQEPPGLEPGDGASAPDSAG